MGGPPLLIHGNVGPATGEVRHAGEVRIDGNLLSGGRVRADGDLHILGNVTSAKARASGKLTVDGVVSGSDTVLDAIQSVTVGQADDALIIAGRDILVLTAAERCQLRAGGEILLRGAPGLLRGGVARAGRGVTAKRIEAGAGTPARIEIGGPVFDGDPAELEARLAFARNQTARANRKSGESPEAYRRGLAGLRAYRKLARTLSHRVRQMRAANRGPASLLTVTGDGPISAVLLLGPDGRAVVPPPNGPFELVLTGEGSDRPSTWEPAGEQ